MTNGFITLAEMSLELLVPKSKLQYYDHSGLIKCDFTAGKTRFYNKKKLFSTIKKIEKLKAEGFSLVEIKNKIK